MFCTSCGKTLEEGAMFCTGCGKKIEMPNSSVADENVTESQVTPEEPKVVYNAYNPNEEPKVSQGQPMGYSQPQQQFGGQPMGYSQPQQQFGAPQMGYTQPQYGNPQYGNPMNPVQNDYMNKMMYKKSVLPFKIVAAIMNLIALFFITLIGLASIGIGEAADDDYTFEIIREMTDGYSTLGFVTLGFAAVMFILVILGFALPAKGGLVASFINIVLGCTSAIWCIVLSAGVRSDLKEYFSIFGSNSEADNLMVGMMVVGVIALIFYFISFIMCIIGFCKKKKY